MQTQAGGGLKALMHSFPRAGRLEWIGVRSAHREPVHPVEQAQAMEGRGLAGDRRLTGGAAAGGKRQVTLIQREHLIAVGQLLGRGDVEPALVRRNLVISGVNLLALKDCDFRIGEAVFRFTGLCHPCSRMEEALGAGGYNAMRGHGGITAAVVSSGLIRAGQAVEVV